MVVFMVCPFFVMVCNSSAKALKKELEEIDTKPSIS